MMHFELRTREVDEMAESHVRSDREIDDHDRMWALFCEAVQTSSRLSPPPRSGYPVKSAWPETPDELDVFAKVAAYLRGELSEMPDNPARPQVSAVQMSRHDLIMRLFHVCALRSRHPKGMQPLPNWMSKRPALMLYAKGTPPRRVKAAYGIPPRVLSRVKVRAMDDMLWGLGVVLAKKACP